MIGSIFKYLVIGIAAIIAIKFAIGLVGLLFGLAVAAIPVAVIGYLAYRIFNKKSAERQLSDADRRWLES